LLLTCKGAGGEHRIQARHTEAGDEQQGLDGVDEPRRRGDRVGCIGEGV